MRRDGPPEACPAVADAVHPVHVGVLLRRRQLDQLGLVPVLPAPEAAVTAMATIATAARTLRAKVLSYLRAGSVTVLRATWTGGVRIPDQVMADVIGHNSTYIVRLTGGVWSCTCGQATECRHVASVQLVTGHPTPVRPTP